MSKKADSKKEVKSSKKDSAKKTKKGGIKKYFRDLKSEIKKVVWPDKAKVVNNTSIVIGVMVVVGLLLFGIDSELMAGMNALLSIGGK